MSPPGRRAYRPPRCSPRGGILIRTILAATVLALALAAPVTAEHCETYSTRVPVAAAGDHYVDWDCFAVLLCQTDSMGGLWIYEEANGIPGLQRGDEMVDDTCHGQIPSDKIIF